MRRRDVTWMLLMGCQAFVLVTLALVDRLVLPGVARTLAESGARQPTLTRVALTPYLLPIAGAIAAACVVIAIAGPRPRRNGWTAGGVVVSGLAVVVVVAGAFWPLFQGE